MFILGEAQHAEKTRDAAKKEAEAASSRLKSADAVYKAASAGPDPSGGNWPVKPR